MGISKAMLSSLHVTSDSSPQKAKCFMQDFLLCTEYSSLWDCIHTLKRGRGEEGSGMFILWRQMLLLMDAYRISKSTF